MKRSLLASILGITVCASNAHADVGQVIYANYFSSFYPVVWADTANGHTAGHPVQTSDSFTAVLFYGMGAGLSFDQLTPTQSSESPVGNFGAFTMPGAFGPTLAILPNWIPGMQVTFGIEVYNGPDYASSTYRTLNNITFTVDAGVVSPYGGPLTGIDEGSIYSAYPNGFWVYAVPEPEALTLLGLAMTFLFAIRSTSKESRIRSRTS